MSDHLELEMMWSLGGGKSATDPLDAAMEYLRRRLGRVLGLYLIAVAPMTGAVFWLIDVVTAEHRSGLAGACAAFTAATFWRWGWLAVIQRSIQAEFRGDPMPPLRRYLPEIFWIRLVTNVMLTWGSIALFPPLYALFVGGFAAPVILEQPGSVMAKLWETLQSVHRSLTRVSRIAGVLTVMMLLGMVAVAALHVVMLNTVLPDFLGLDTTSLRLTMSSAAWFLSVGYFFFLIFDCYWAVASVMIFYDLQATRLGTDLRHKLQRLQAA